MGELPPAGLRRHLGLLQATAINVTMVVGAGVFMTIPVMLQKLPGLYALLGWLVAGALILVDGLVWSELGAALPGSGGSYVYLLESFGRERWGRLTAFLFIWQFLFSGPLELASGLILMDGAIQSLSSEVSKFDEAHRTKATIYANKKEDVDLSLTFGPVRAACIGIGALCIVLLYRSVTTLGRLAVVFWAGVLAAIGWILLEGVWNFDPGVAFDFAGALSPTLPLGFDSDAAKLALGFGIDAAKLPFPFVTRLGAAMVVAIYCYLGYYNICYMADEVREPGRTIPRAILLSCLLIIVLFVALHLAMLGTVRWQAVVENADRESGAFNLAAMFMERVRGPWAARAITVLIVGSMFASVFSGMLGYSRIPFGAARQGHFFAALGRVHPRHQIPHVSLLVVGGLTLAWAFFDFGTVLDALITTRLLEQFVLQIIGLMLLRRSRPEGPWPFRMWLYPVPCLLALAGWLFVYSTSRWLFIGISLSTLATGVVVFLAWSASAGQWPFATRRA